MMLPVSATSKEKLKVTVAADVDPTGAIVEVGASTTTVAPTSWTAAAWSGSYASGRATFLTPTIGPAGTIALAAGSTIDLWARITTADEVIVFRFERVTAF